MELKKYGHACLRLEKDGKVLVIDPGAFSEPEALEGADAVLITHSHYDHMDVERLRRCSPDVEIRTCEGAAAELGVLPATVLAVNHGDKFEVAGFSVEAFGEWHARSHPDLPVIQNIGFMIDSSVFYPGDAFTVPEVDVHTLMVPTGAPWLRLGDVLEYLRVIRPRRAYSTHDGLYNDAGLQLVDNWLKAEADKQGAEIRRLAVGETVTLH